ncbi:SPOR domain-containing protein [Tenacibaculum finnmarkense]|uniref:SPOR domain-containing protein n=1 Tax=Tenacibaculum finnmarkense TaxID=2781243 RepID=UPI001EFABA7D|nr:SPOR domain-containing protein [Tenacibaculum finnmarkense]MCG8894453.1 SPOR domain-containing protein [Tenacibaculum finnmarkense]MCG8902603.1 SPOR domain-containing protein [Tenacibaculum finnmarkense]
MPLIDDKEFLKICKELDHLKEKEKDLERGYIDLKLENVKISNGKKYRILLIFALGTLVLFLIVNMYYKHDKFTAINHQKKSLEKLIDSINNVTKLEESARLKKQKTVALLVKNKIVFTVQIGAFGNLKMPETLTQEGGIRKMANNLGEKTEKYIAGAFSTYQNARIFRDEIKKIGIKDGFVVALRNGKKISISTAVKLSNTDPFDTLKESSTD